MEISIITLKQQVELLPDRISKAGNRILCQIYSQHPTKSTLPYLYKSSRLVCLLSVSDMISPHLQNYQIKFEQLHIITSLSPVILLQLQEVLPVKFCIPPMMLFGNHHPAP